MNTILNEILNAAGVQGSDDELRQRFGKYAASFSHGGVLPIEELAAKAQVTTGTAYYDLQRLVSRGFFGKEAYIDYMRRALVLPEIGKAAPQPRPASAPQKAAPAAPAAAVPQPQKLFRKQKNWLLAGGVTGLVLGAWSLVSGVLALFTGAAAGALLPGAALLACGLGCMGGRQSLENLAGRYRKYRVLLGSKKAASIPQLAAAVGIGRRKAVRELEKLTYQGYFGEGAMVDRKNGYLLLAAETAMETPEPAPAPIGDSEYDGILKEIRRLNDEIADEAVSRQMERMEEVTRKIFHTVRENPEKKPQIKSFLSYYLPTTLKLLRSYRDFERQGVSGENIDAAKEKISGILDTLVKGFEQQLDQLYQADAMDISADINVLETMLKRDGLSEDASGFARRQ